MGKDGKKRRRSVGKLQTRDDRPQAIRARQAAAHQNTSDTEQRLQQQLEAYHSENRSLCAELVNESYERWHTVQACLPRRP